MLVMKHGVTPIYQLETLPISHHLYAFLLCKKAYLDMNALHNAMTNKANIFNLKDVWKEFTESNEYRRLRELVRSDKELI